MGLTVHPQPTKNIHGLSSDFLERNDIISGVTQVLARTQNKNLLSKKIPLISRHLTLPITTTICPAPPIPNRLSTFAQKHILSFLLHILHFSGYRSTKTSYPTPEYLVAVCPSEKRLSLSVI